MWKKNIFYCLIIVNFATQAMDDKPPKQHKKYWRTLIVRVVTPLLSTHHSRTEQSTSTSSKKMVSCPYDVEKFFLCNLDICNLILSYFYIHTTGYKETCKNFARFSVVSKSINEYFTYNDAAKFKEVIENIAKIYNTGNLYVAKSIYKPIATKITTLIEKASNEKESFTQDDLKDTWYLNATFRNPTLKTLLFLTTNYLQVEKTRALINAGARADMVCEGLNAFIYLSKRPFVRTHTSYFLYNPYQEEKLIAILHLLLNTGIHPDSRQNNKFRTFLHLVAQLSHKNIAYTLLLHGANPYATYYDDIAQRTHTAFTIEYGTPKGWLKEMYLTILLFNDNNLIELITDCLCALVNNLPILAQTIKNFSIVNKSLHTYYRKNEVRKHIVRTIATHLAISDLEVAEQMNYKEIAQQIKTIFSLDQSGQFAPDSLQDRWYIDATVPGTKESHITLLTPICVTTTMLNPQATQMLIDAKCNLGSDRYPNPLAVLAGSALNYQIMPQDIKENTFKILKSLLKAQINPDSRYTISCLTYLQHAAQNGNKSIARLLLQHGADPYKLYFNGNHQCIHGSCLQECTTSLCTNIRTSLQTLPITTCYRNKTNKNTPWQFNAFHLEQGHPKGWLKEIYKKVLNITGDSK